MSRHRAAAALRSGARRWWRGRRRTPSAGRSRSQQASASGNRTADDRDPSLRPFRPAGRADGLQPVADRRRRLDGDVHGGAGHQHRQRRAAAHRRQPVGRPGRGDLGADQLSGRQRHHPADQRLARDGHRPQALLHDLRGAVHRQLVPLRHRAEPAAADLLPRAAGHRRRRAGAQRAGHPRRHLPAEEARDGVRRLRHRRRRRAGGRADAGRVDHRQLLLAVDLLHQRARRAALAVPQPPGRAWTRRRWSSSASRCSSAGCKVDYVGFALVALGLGCLQVVLDKGQEDDWFGSQFITIFTDRLRRLDRPLRLLGTAHRASRSSICRC